MLTFPPLNPQIQPSKKSERFFVSPPQDSVCFKPQHSFSTALNIIPAGRFAAWVGTVPATALGNTPGINFQHRQDKDLLGCVLPWEQQLLPAHQNPPEPAVPTEMPQTQGFHPHGGLQASQHPLSANSIPKEKVWEQT